METSCTQVARSTTGGALIKWWKRLSFDDRYVSIPSPEVMDQSGDEAGDD